VYFPVATFRERAGAGRGADAAAKLAKFEAACRQAGRDPATIGVTALIRLWLPDLEDKKPAYCDKPLTGQPAVSRISGVGQFVDDPLNPRGPEMRLPTRGHRAQNASHG
jgi:hypothetical protein